MKLLAKEENNTRKCQKESKKWICKALHRGQEDSHRGHDDSHRATMGTDLVSKQIF
jgi:hypothetical protein